MSNLFDDFDEEYDPVLEAKKKHWIEKYQDYDRRFMEAFLEKDWDQMDILTENMDICYAILKKLGVEPCEYMEEET